MAVITSTSNEEVKDGIKNGNFRVVFFTPELLLDVRGEGICYRRYII